MKKLLLAISISLITQLTFAFDNPVTDSYGTWAGKGQFGEKYNIVINRHGFEDYHKTNLEEKCHGKLYFRQKLITYSGKQLLKQINESTKMYQGEEDYKEAIAYWQKIKTRINQNQQYKVIRVDSDCADNYEEFAFLSPNEGIYIHSDPEDSYDYLRKIN